MSIQLNKEVCKSCGLCARSCPFGALIIENRYPVMGEGCTGCGACVEACPFGALKKQNVQTGEEATVSQYQDVWVYAEQRDGKLSSVVIELLGKGRNLADALGHKLCAILPGADVAGMADELIAYGADCVYLCENDVLLHYTTEGYAKVVAEAVETYKPEILLIGATHIGRDLAPRLAARLNTGLTADCTSLEIDSESKGLQQTRPAFGGHLMATIICPAHRPQMSTVRPGVMEKAAYNPNRTGEIIRLSVALDSDDINARVIETVKQIKEQIALTDARILVAGGKGLGKKEGFELLKELADALGGSIAATRACVDEGWIDHAYQVGQTGTTVKPDLYIACGISGAIQHLAGMQNSGVIVSINKDADAPISDIANYSLTGDLYEIIPELLRTLRQ